MIDFPIDQEVERRPHHGEIIVDPHMWIVNAFFNLGFTSFAYSEQDHRSIKRPVRAMQGFRAFHSACRTIQGIETVNMIRKGQVRSLAKGDITGQVAFISRLFGIGIAA